MSCHPLDRDTVERTAAGHEVRMRNAVFQCRDTPGGRREKLAIAAIAAALASMPRSTGSVLNQLLTDR